MRNIPRRLIPRAQRPSSRPFRDRRLPSPQRQGPRDYYPIQKRRKQKAPVLVWIYGGGYTGGYKTQCPADSLIAQSHASNSAGVIFVQLNYRVRPSIHILTCSLTILKAGRIWIPIRQGVQGNAGFLDQRPALQWVRDHIEQFGGDPEQVTVMGQSAGAGSIEDHITSRETAYLRRPLFQQAIMQSPFFFPDPGQTQNKGTYAQYLKFAGTPSIAAAKNASAKALRTANYQIVLNAPYEEFGFGE